MAFKHTVAFALGLLTISAPFAAHYEVVAHDDGLAVVPGRSWDQ